MIAIKGTIEKINNGIKNKPTWIIVFGENNSYDQITVHQFSGSLKSGIEKANKIIKVLGMKLQEPWERLN